LSGLELAGMDSSVGNVNIVGGRRCGSLYLLLHWNVYNSWRSKRLHDCRPYCVELRNNQSCQRRAFRRLPKRQPGWDHGLCDVCL
jgi:hypothetical protein